MSAACDHAKPAKLCGVQHGLGKRGFLTGAHQRHPHGGVDIFGQSSNASASPSLFIATGDPQGKGKFTLGSRCDGP